MKGFCHDRHHHAADPSHSFIEWPSLFGAISSYTFVEDLFEGLTRKFIEEENLMNELLIRTLLSGIHLKNQ